MTLPTVRMSKAEFDGLLEYSTSLPTSPSVGRQWKRRQPAFGDPASWFLGTAVEDPEPGWTRIEWAKIQIETPRETQVRMALAKPGMGDDKMLNGLAVTDVTNWTLLPKGAKP